MSAAWPMRGRRWTEAELCTDSAAAVVEFRARRLGEPLARYLDAFDASREVNATLISKLGKVLGDGESETSLLQSLWASESGRTAFRYLGAPPISQDDLETLAQTRLSASAAGDAHGKRDRLLSVMRAILDPRRFPWIAQQRLPTKGELQAAVLATTSLIASQRVQTLRRGDEKSMVERSGQRLVDRHGLELGARAVGTWDPESLERFAARRHVPDTGQSRQRQRGCRRPVARWSPARDRMQGIEQRDQ